MIQYNQDIFYEAFNAHRLIQEIIMDMNQQKVAYGFWFPRNTL